jgi:hypothetical protein
MNVAIFGFMGVGKSSVGKLVADALGMEFVDIDDTIVAGVGMIIPSIFKERGEKGFRELAYPPSSRNEARRGSGNSRKTPPRRPQKWRASLSPAAGGRSSTRETSEPSEGTRR